VTVHQARQTSIGCGGDIFIDEEKGGSEVRNRQLHSLGGESGRRHPARGQLDMQKENLCPPLSFAPPLLPHSPPPSSLAASACARRGWGGGAQRECGSFHRASARGPSRGRTKDVPLLFLGAAKARRILSFSADPIRNKQQSWRRSRKEVDRDEQMGRKTEKETRGD
jgi:hypothetical protein